MEKTRTNSVGVQETKDIWEKSKGKKLTFIKSLLGDSDCKITSDYGIMTMWWWDALCLCSLIQFSLTNLMRQWLFSLFYRRWKWAQSIIFQPQSHFKWVSNLGFQTWTACSLHQQHHAASWAAGFWGILDSDHSQEGNWALTPVSYCLTSSLVFAVLYLFQSLNLKN